MQIFPLEDRKATWLGYLALLGVLSWLCFGGLRHHLLDTHDAQSFEDHLRIDQDETFFFSPNKAQASGRPFAEAIKYAIYRLWGNDLVAFHLSVVALHALASLLLAGVCRRLGMDLELSLLGGLIFLVNVTHFQAVHHISALDYPLALVCALLSLGAYLAYLDTGSRGWWGLFVLCLLLGLMAHLSAAAVVPFVLVYRWRQGGQWRALGRQALALGVPLAGALAVLLAVTSHQTSTWWSIGEYAEHSLLSLAAGMGRMLLWFVSRLLTTAHWIPLPIYQLQTWELFLGGALLAGLLVSIWKQVWPAWLWAVWLLFWLVPFLMLTETTILDLPAGPSRYLYPASAGSSLLLAWILREGIGRLRRGRRGLFVALLLLLLFSSYRSLSQVEAISLYTSGRYYIAENDERIGVQQLRRALDRGPEVIPLEDAILRMAMIMLSTDEDPEPLLRQGLFRFPRSAYLRLLMAVLEAESENSSIRTLGQARLQQLGQGAENSGNRDFFAFNVATAYHNLGLKYTDAGEMDRAIHAFHQALRYVPGRSSTIEALHQVYFRMGLEQAGLSRFDEAIAAYSRALEFNPGDISARNNLGWVLYLQGRFDEAIDQYRAILAAASSSQARFNLGLAYLARGDVEEAEKTYAQAIEEFGAAEGRAIGAVSDLRALIESGVREDAGERILRRYWPDEAGDGSS